MYTPKLYICVNQCYPTKLKNICEIFLNIKYLRITLRRIWIKHSKVITLLIYFWMFDQFENIDMLFKVLNSSWGSWNPERLNDLPKDTQQCNHIGRTQQATSQMQIVSHLFAHVILLHSASLLNAVPMSSYCLCFQLHGHFVFTCLQPHRFRPRRVGTTYMMLTTIFCASAELAAWGDQNIC